MDKINRSEITTHDSSVAMLLIGGFVALCLFTVVLLVGIF